MSIRFAAAPSANTPRMSRAAVRAHDVCADNDNTDMRAREEMLSAALQLIVTHGSAAAREAGDRARTAAYEGDRANYRWWLGVCLALDRRLAHAIEESDRASA